MPRTMERKNVQQRLTLCQLLISKLRGHYFGPLERVRAVNVLPGPDVLDARGSFPTDVHQVLIPRSHIYHKYIQTHTHDIAILSIQGSSQYCNIVHIGEFTHRIVVD